MNAPAGFAITLIITALMIGFVVVVDELRNPGHVRAPMIPYDRSR